LPTLISTYSVVHGERQSIIAWDVAKTRKAYVFNDDAIIVVVILPCVELDPNVRSVAYELAEILGFQEIAVGLTLTDNHSSVNSNNISTINVNGDLTVSEQTSDQGNITGSMEKYII